METPNETPVESPSETSQDVLAETPQQQEESQSDKVYIVEKGDTLATISKKIYGDITHVDAICKANGLEDGNLIFIGQKLLLP